MTIRSGRMRHLVDIQARALTPDASGTGEQSFVWTSVVGGGIFAEQTPMTGGREVVAALQLQGRVPTLWRLRWMAGLTDALVPRMRLVWTDPASRARWFDILEVQAVGGTPNEIVLVTQELVEVPL